MLRYNLFIFFLLLISNKGLTQKNANPRNLYDSTGMIFGCNYIPSSAINQLDMWQALYFDTITISRELKIASTIGMNVIRVYLHDLAYRIDPRGFLRRLDAFLTIADRFNIKVLFVFFDSCWDPFPFSGKQAEPVPKRHNSHWVQSPGYVLLKDSMQYDILERYIKDVVKRFANDKRVFGWDAWNEPDFTNVNNSYGKEDLPDKAKYVQKLLKLVFAWIHSVKPSQFVTSGLWKLYDNWTSNYSFDAIEKIQIENSDIITFHFYGNADELEKRIIWLKQLGKPVICTEYLARKHGSNFETCLPVFIKYNVGAINWGLVSGKTQTIYDWDSWEINYINEPLIWHHDIFRGDGTPYKLDEIEYIKKALLRRIDN